MSPENTEKKSWDRLTQESWDRLTPEERAWRVQQTIEGIKKTHHKKISALLGGEPEQVLNDLVGKYLSVSEIAAQIGKTEKTISCWLGEAHLQTKKRTTLSRETIESRQTLINLAQEAGLMKHLRPQTRSVLERRYCGDGRIIPLEDIGQQFNLTRERIRQREARGLTLLERMLSGELMPKGEVILPRGRWNARIKELEEKLGENPQGSLRLWYDEQRLSIGDIAVKLGCSYTKARRLMEQFGIARKTGPKKRLKDN